MSDYSDLALVSLPSSSRSNPVNNLHSAFFSFRQELSELDKINQQVLLNQHRANSTNRVAARDAVQKWRAKQGLIPTSVATVSHIGIATIRAEEGKKKETFLTSRLSFLLCWIALRARPTRTIVIRTANKLDEEPQCSFTKLMYGIEKRDNENKH